MKEEEEHKKLKEEEKVESTVDENPNVDHSNDEGDKPNI